MGTTEIARLDWLMHKIGLAKEKGKAIDKKKLIAICAIDTGCSYRTAREALQVLIDANKVKL